ncbi:pectate lyase [Flavobacterium sp. TP390]|uniref:Pectinesterase n=1 Tax=Flavobacterium profundi TaxID=1774945 RepID=A0A6I4IFA0_9FLAO|nr:pectate lyase [Flavobacterium profundi]MVO08284.1 pectate lyase [Flavobacterium profundi]
MNYKPTHIATIIVVLFVSLTRGQVLNKSWKDIIYKSERAWFSTTEAKEIAENVLLYQRNIGGWPKNIQMQQKLSEDEKDALSALKSSTKEVTTDNGATIQEMEFLSKIYENVPDNRYKEAFLKGINYLLEAQYENGGWPQFYPLKKGYYTHITYNDDSMVNILSLLKEIKDRSDYYSIKPNEEIVSKAQTAFNKGIDCILKTQYKQNGVLTSWCAQHDEKTLLPAKGRAYELPSLSGHESANIVLLLMAVENPSPEIIKAVHAAVAWFEKVQINNLREERIYNDEGKVIDKKLIHDEKAKPLWARFMELENNKPFFCDRDGIKKYSLAEIGPERRNGYAWYITTPEKVLKKYPKWKEKYGITATKIPSEDKYYMVVAQDGSGDYTNIQEAINNAKAFPYEKITIFIKKGVYNEKIKIHEWNTNIHLIGESKEKTIIRYDDAFNKVSLGRNSTFYTYTLLVEANDTVLQNLTIENAAGEVGQAVALSVFSNRVVVENCNILGNQDTLYASGIGKQYYKNCYIEGTTDFIFGSATAYFENCIIHSKKDSYITAASTPKDANFGYVFKNCHLTASDTTTQVYLGRPWRIYAKTVFIQCTLDQHILPEGWHNWSKPEAEKTTFFAEFENKGAGAISSKRVAWSHQLTKKEIKRYRLQNILGSNESQSNWYETK